MKKIQRILALLGVILLLAMYGSTMIFAISGNPDSTGWFKASIYCTIVVPVLLYAYALVYKHLKNRNQDYDFMKDDHTEKESEKND